MGGIHVTSLPEEALLYADAIIIGPADDSWLHFLIDFRNGNPKRIYYSTKRTIENIPMPRRDLYNNNLYLVPNTIVVSRGCPHSCSFCYKDNFFRGGKSFYTQTIDRVLKEIDHLKGRHLFFLDDHLFGNRKFAMELFTALKGMNKIWQAAGTVSSILDEQLISIAVDAGLSSLFVGFETLTIQNLKDQNKLHNIKADYEKAINILHNNGVMINASFVFGMDQDDNDVFSKTVEWSVSKSLETATFHILTPYPGTDLYNQLNKEKRIISKDWNKYDTRHAVFTPGKMSVEELEAGYFKAYSEFYKWSSIFKSGIKKNDLEFMIRHMAYTTGWKKLEWFWEFIIRKQKIYNMIPMLEKVLSH